MSTGKISQAFVLGAGLGTRLRPLTDDLPKPLVPIFQKPLITFAFDHLVDIGVPGFLVNTHHRPECFAEAFPKSSYRERPIEFFHEPDLLETAGGIANLQPSLGHEPLLVYNGDILTDLPLGPLLDEHFRTGNMVTLALRSNVDPKHIALDRSSGRIVDIRNQLGSGAPDEFVFTGIYIVEPEFVDRLDRGVKRSVIPHFVELIRYGEKIGGIVIDDGNWWDVRDRGLYMALHHDLRALNFPRYPVDDPNWRASVHETANIHSSARLSGASVVGRNCHVESEAELVDTILWPGAQMASRSRLERCIVRSHRRADGTHSGIDI